MTTTRTERARSRFEEWAWSPIIVLRVALVITYLLYVYAAVIAFLAGIPIFSLVAWEGYASIWAALLAPAAIVSAIGAITERWEKVERWGAAALASLMLGYMGSLNLIGFVAHDLGRQFIGAISLIALVLPATRFVWLAAQAGKKKVTNPEGDDASTATVK